MAHGFHFLASTRPHVYHLPRTTKLNKSEIKPTYYREFESTLRCNTPSEVGDGPWEERKRCRGRKSEYQGNSDDEEGGRNC